jgi:hypothetical protein
MLMCLYASKVYYDFKKELTAVSKLFLVYFVTASIMVVYELFYHQIMTIYYCVLFASFGQVVGL